MEPLVLGPDLRGREDTRLPAQRLRIDEDFSPRYKAALTAIAKFSLRGKLHRVSEFAYVAKWVPYCDSPVGVELTKPGRDKGLPLSLTMKVPCRKCAKCVKFRQMRWRARAINELVLTHNAGRRSWWITLTFSPVHLAGVLAEATFAGDRSPKGVECAAYAHVQRYLDRLRKASKTRFRYLAVYERGETTGRSHYHLLIHEVGPKPILKATIEDRWPSHVHARLVQMGTRTSGLASYISKYATKTLDVRPRASVSYGSPVRTSGRAPKRARNTRPVF